MNKKAMGRRRIYARITAVMMAVLLIITASPAFRITAVQAEEKAKDLVQLRIDGKKITKKTYRMKQGTKKKLKITAKKIRSVKFRSSKKSVAAVSKTGVIYAKKAGTAKITAVVKKGTSRTKQGKRAVWMKVQVVEPSRPNETKKPDVTAGPSGTDRPANTSSPNAASTNAPVNGTMPSETPVSSAAPDITAKPAETTAPIPTVIPTPILTPIPSASSTPSASSKPSEDGSKILIAYFTRSGNTETLADSIQEKTGGTKFKIETVRDYPEDYSGVYDEAMKEQRENARPELKTRVDHMADYDTVFVGYPIWHGDTPMAIRSFLESYDFSGKKVIPFCSSGSSRPDTSYASVRASASGAEVLDGFWTRGADVGNAADEINQWIDGLEIIQKKEEEEPMADQIMITAGNTVFTAVLAGNSSAGAFRELLFQGPLTIHMSDYASMEKVGPIGTSLPRNDERIITEAGDIILYQGNSLVIYYDTNIWNFTRIGKIEGATKEQLLAALGSGDVTVTITLAP